MTADSPSRHRLAVEADRLRDYADALDRRAEGDRTAFTETHLLGLYRTVGYVHELLVAFNALPATPRRTVIPFPERTRS